MNLTTFLDTYRDALAHTVIQAYPPLYEVEARQTSTFDLRRLLRRPLGAQADAIRATVLALQRSGSASIVGEMGTGKSYIGAAAAYLAGCHCVLVLCPPHLVKKWRREILQTVPGARVAIVRTIGDLERVLQQAASVQFVVCSREQAKLGYRWAPAVVPRVVRDETGGVARDDRGNIVRSLGCPTCFAPIVDEEGVPLTRDELATKKRRCGGCGDPLWQADRRGPRRYPLADYIVRRMPHTFDLLIADEAHELKARGSAQGLAAGALAAACGRTLTLTGTVFGGYASTLFYLLWRFSPALRREFGYHDEARWVSRYGIVERITKKDPDRYTDDGRHSKRRSYWTRVVEKPGVSPMVLFHLIGHTVFLRLADVAQTLPPYSERVALYRLSQTAAADGPSQATAYRGLADQLWQAVTAALQEGSKRLLATYLQALLAYPDACTRGETVLDPHDGQVIAYAPALSADVLYPKEQALVELVRRERARRRRVLVFITHTESRDISPRLRAILEREGLRVAVLKAGSVAADRREEWVAARVREGVDVLICHPRLVQTGLDLIDWPSIVWYEVEYSVYVMRQASRRSWRIGQHQPVEVTYLVYEETLQADALALVAAKMRSALMVEGELPEEGLAALEGDGQDMVVALARQLTEGGVQDGQSLEALFAQTQAVEAEADGYLVEGVWEQTDEAGANVPLVSPTRFDLDVPDQRPLDLWPTVFAAELPSNGKEDVKPDVEAQGRMVDFDELARMVRRPRRRGKPVPEGQLALF